MHTAFLNSQQKEVYNRKAFLRFLSFFIVRKLLEIEQLLAIC